VYFYHLLPNAPVADPDYLEKWQIETIRRYVFTFSDTKRERRPVDLQTVKNRIIVSTKTFSRNDWIAMNAYAAFVMALHNCGLTQLIAKYLRFTHGVPYRKFYEELIEGFCARVEPMKSWYQAVVDHYHAFLADEEAIDFMDVFEWPRYRYQVNPFQWVYVQSCMQLESFFDTVKEFLVEKYPLATNLASVIEYQRNLVILPNYRKENGKSFATDFNWVEYFEAANQLSTYEPLDEPDPAPDSAISVSDQTCTDGIALYPLDWNSGNEEDDWAVWFDRTVENHSRPARTNFQQLELRRKGEPQLSEKSGRFVKFSIFQRVRNFIKSCFVSLLKVK
jgi:putative methyltransferase